MSIYIYIYIYTHTHTNIYLHEKPVFLDNNQMKNIYLYTDNCIHQYINKLTYLITFYKKNVKENDRWV